MLRRLAEGYTSRHGPRAAYVHRDAVNGTLRGRRGAQLYAVTSGGTIPENADYTVVLEPHGLNIGTVNEDFAVESLAGDVFQLGNASYRIMRIESGRRASRDCARRSSGGSPSRRPLRHLLRIPIHLAIRTTASQPSPSNRPRLRSISNPPSRGWSNRLIYPKRPRDRSSNIWRALARRSARCRRKTRSSWSAFSMNRAARSL